MKKFQVFLMMAFVCFFAFAGISSAVAADQESSIMPVEVVDLPEPVQEFLQSSDFKEYIVSESFAVLDSEGAAYVVTLVKGDESKTIKVSPEGELIK